LDGGGGGWGSWPLCTAFFGDTYIIYSTYNITVFTE
jgi:hypothetical protein